MYKNVSLPLQKYIKTINQLNKLLVLPEIKNMKKNLVAYSDVKRGQNLEAEAEAKASRPRRNMARFWTAKSYVSFYVTSNSP